MSDYLYVRHFGPVKEMKIPLSKLMVFIGSQGTGKSTVAKLLTLLSSVMEISENDFSYFGMDKYFYGDTVIEYRTDTFVFKYHAGFFEYTWNDAKSETKNFIQRLPRLGTVVPQVIGNNFDKHLSKGEAISGASLLIALFRMGCYIPAERTLAGTVSSALANIMLANIPLPGGLLEYMALYERARNHFTDYNVSFLGVQYKKELGSDCIVVDREENRSLPLEACSSGVQSALPMLMVLDYAAKECQFGTYVVEEPEQNLFPTNQMELLRVLIGHLNGQPQARMILNTHSPYLLSALNVSMMASKVAENEELKSAVGEIVSPNHWINPADVGVYALGGDDEFCVDVKDSKTGLISANYLDSVSEIIDSDFDRLYRLYMKGQRQ